MGRHDIRLKRAYAPASADDGIRLLVDLMWPRGVSKQKIATHAWLKDIAPSTGLRQWFGHDPAKWIEFRKRYFAELKTNPALATLRELTAKGTVTLVYAAADTEHCNATALREYLQR